MFTGIVEEVGTLKAIRKGPHSAVLEIAAQVVLEDIHLGDSIAVNGVCLTATSFTAASFTADVIIDEVCKFYNIEPDSLRGQGRTKDISLARQIAMYQIRRMTNLSLKEIGREFEGRDHTTVLHSIERIEKMVKESPETAEIIKDITANINIRYE